MMRKSWAAIGLVAALLLGGCAERISAPPPPIVKPAETPWTAAIGRMDVDGAQSCTAVLVAPSTILTASHCLHQAEIPALPQSVHFHPNYGAEPELPPSVGVAIRAQGGAIREGRLNKPEQVAADWVLVGIAPPVKIVAPIPLADLSAQAILDRIGHGDRLFTAGYGYGGMKALKQHGKCAVVNPKLSDPIYATGMLVTNCIIRVGDSGGPVILLDDKGKPKLIGLFAGFGMGSKLGLSYAVNASRVTPYLNPPLVSYLVLLPPEAADSVP